MRRRSLLIFLAFSTATLARADGPADNNPTAVRQVPRPGIELSEAERQEIEAGLARLRAAIDDLDTKAPRVADLRPDVEIFHKAVHDALNYREFFARPEIARAKSLLALGLERAEQLAAGRAPWTTQTGLVVRGYGSKIDGSVQPYGLVIPADSDLAGGPRLRLDVWFHGRGETLSEVNFLDQRLHQRGEFTPADTIVLHPYGRFCNAFKFAGEVDVVEALDDVKAKYRIDDDRVAVRGFSMGGAACWQFAVHYSSDWFAANPGAGFAETARFLNVFQKEKVQPTWYERKLWHLYDCTDYAGNLLQCPTVAYSGEVDAQKQAADVMAEAMAEHGLHLAHVIGPKTAHKYHPDSAREVERRMDSLAAAGRDRTPSRVDLTTYTLRYPRMNWVTIDALAAHWERARVIAEVNPKSHLIVTTKNTTALTLDMPAGTCPFDPRFPVTIVAQEMEGGSTPVEIEGPRPLSDRSWRCQLHLDGEAWKVGPPPADGLHKRHGLQGPIDDAFMDSFVFVRPTGRARNGKVQKWVDAEFARAVERWRRQFRGEARIVDDTDVGDAEIAGANLVLWGDPESNAVLKRIALSLPLKWGDDAIRAGEQSFDAAHHVPILIYPNPLNPDRYVVVNSGFTYREYDDLNNARQVPKLPDWAVVDLDTPPDARTPGKVVAADFFGERWELRPKAETP